MSYLDNLYSEKNRYEGLKSNVDNAIEKLSVIASDLEIPITNLNNSFQIDGFSLGANELNAIKSSLETRTNYLNNNVIPNIKSEISSLDSKIYEEEDRIRKEKEELERQERERQLNLLNSKDKSSKQESTNSGSK